MGSWEEDAGLNHLYGVAWRSRRRRRRRRTNY